MKYRNILFDLDGTLTDSGPGIMKSCKYAFEQLGVPIPSPQELRKVVGPPLNIIFPTLGIPEDKVDEAINLFRDKYNNHGGVFDNSVYPGIEDMLSKLKDLGYKLYVATSKPEETARLVMSHFNIDKYFDYIAGGSIALNRAKKSDVLKYLLDTIDCSGGIIMIGDTHYDVIGAHELDIPCIGVAWGYGDIDTMNDEGVDAVIKKPGDIFELI